MQRLKNWVNYCINYFRNKLYPTHDTEFRGSLTVTIVSLILFLSLIPTLFWIFSNYYKNRQLLYEQTASQMQVFVTNQNNQLRQLTYNTNQALTQLTGQPLFMQALTQYLQNPGDASAQTSVRLQMNIYRDPNINQEATIDQFFILMPDGKIGVATKDTWNEMDTRSLPEIYSLFGFEGSQALYDPQPLYANRLVVFTTHTYRDEKGAPQATIVATSTSSLPQYVLASSSSFLPLSNAFYLTKYNDLLRVHPAGNAIIRIPFNSAYTDSINTMLKNGHEGAIGILQSLTNQNVLTYAQIQPELQTILLVEVPLSIVYAQANPFSNLTFFALILALAIIGISVAFLSSQIIRPILDLVTHARNYAKGDWSQHVDVKRKDEIGLLGHTFNQMGDQLSILYGSLESQVNERTLQMRSTFEVAQLATSSSDRQQIIDQTVALLVDRFKYIFAGIFLVDESGSYLVLQAISRLSPIDDSKIGIRIRINSESTPGWVALNNQSRVITNLDSHSFSEQILVDGTKSEAVIPIAVGGQILGVLDVQSADIATFNQENIITLQTLANQIASKIQNMRLLESAQINLDEMTLFYQSSRQITQAKDEDEVLDIISNALAETKYISGLYAVEEDHLRIVSIHDPRDHHARSGGQGITLPLQHISQALSSDRLVLLENLSERPDLNNIVSFFIRRGCITAAILPVHVDGKLSKILVLASSSSDIFNQTTLQPFSNLVDVTSTTLSRFNLLKSLEISVNEFKTISNFIEVISAETNVIELFKIVHQQVNHIIGDDIGFLIAYYNRKSATIEIPYLYESDEVTHIDPFPIGEGLTSIIIQSQKPLLINKDAERITAELGAKSIGLPAKSWLGIPLSLGNEVIGALILQDLEKEERFTEYHYRLMTAFAPQLAIALRNAQLITDMDRALTSYDQERFLLNTLLHNIPDQIYFKDGNNRYIRTSDSFAHKFGVGNQEELIGKYDTDLYGTDLGDLVQKEDFDILQSGKSKIGVVEQSIDQNGHEVWDVVNRIPMVNENGDISGLLGINHDITELKNAEELAQKIAQQLRTAAEVARDASGTLQFDELLVKAVNLVRDRFGFYHSSIFIIDAAGEYAVLQESTGDAGYALKMAHHRLAVGSQSLVGQATSRGEVMVINEVSGDANYYPNPLLPDTNAELVIPLKVGDKILGAIDVQSTKVNAFLPEDVDILRILADQLSVTLTNARLYDGSQEMLKRQRQIQQITTEAASASSTDDALFIVAKSLQSAKSGDRIAIYFLDDHQNLQLRTSAISEDKSTVPTTVLFGSGIPGKAIETHQSILVKDIKNDPSIAYTGVSSTRSELCVPIFYRDSLLGVIDLQSDQAAYFSEYDHDLITTLSNNLGTIIYNTQLINQVRRQVERQQMLYDISSRIRRSVDIETILQTSAAEICKALGVNKAQIALEVGTSSVMESTDQSRASSHLGATPDEASISKKNGRDWIK